MELVISDGIVRGSPCWDIKMMTEYGYISISDARLLFSYITILDQRQYPKKNQEHRK